MSDQEIINAIDVEISRVWDMDWSKETRETNTTRAAYVNGLRFARDLIVKRMEAGK